MIEKDRSYEAIKKEVKMFEETEYALTIKDLKTLNISEDDVYNLIKNKPRILVAYTTEDVYLPDAVVSGNSELFDCSSSIEEDCEKLMEIIPTLKLRGCGESSQMAEDFMSQATDDIIRWHIPEVVEFQNLLKKIIKNTEE